MRKTCAKIANPRVFYALFLLLDGTGRNFVEVTSAKTGQNGSFDEKSQKCGT